MNQSKGVPFKYVALITLITFVIGWYVGVETAYLFAVLLAKLFGFIVTLVAIGLLILIVWGFVHFSRQRDRVRNRNFNR
jgi:hypothetical protein